MDHRMMSIKTDIILFFTSNKAQEKKSKLRVLTHVFLMASVQTFGLEGMLR